HRPADRMHEYETVETFFPSRPLAPVVNAQRNVEPLELLVDRPEHLRPPMILHSLGSDGDGREPEVRDCAVGFLNRPRRVLEGQQGDSLEPWRLTAYPGDKVVVSAGISDRVVALDKTPASKLVGGNRTETSIPSLSMSLSRVGMSTCSMPPTSPPIPVSIPSEGNKGPRLECGSDRCFRTSASFSTI